ncbi:hypothetical protein CYMTET_56433 [Cymbomonas tetramitiformis]|uniref:Uncharacterized protein n=1 Tax=Cymbomonas tetramitiformis TaxID=36881 RepID=A0AAE0BCB8_9CHLO|nr:hypothetical protein CYMTET_56433 [Cymbomonas tetramitiformis]
MSGDIAVSQIGHFGVRIRNLNAKKDPNRMIQVDFTTERIFEKSKEKKLKTWKFEDLRTLSSDPLDSTLLFVYFQESRVVAYPGNFVPPFLLCVLTAHVIAVKTCTSQAHVVSVAYST